MDITTNTKHDEYVNLRETVSLLGVSSATIRNWVKHSYLTPKELSDSKLMFNLKQINLLKSKISTGDVDRLNKRANKKNSQVTFIPDEYVDSQDVMSVVQEIITKHKKYNLVRDNILLIIAIKLLKEKGLINYTHLNTFDDLNFKNKIIDDEINWWIRNLSNPELNKGYQEILEIVIPKNTNDMLGLLYQSLMLEGSKSESGSYYTPKNIVDDIVDSYVKEDCLILDPCCGTGQFILSAAKKIGDPTKIWGFDIDETAIRLARLNLLIYFSNLEFEPSIYYRNTLTDKSLSNIPSKINVPDFDLIMTNPPWGVHLSKSDNSNIQELFPEIKSGETFSYFIKKGLDLLKEGGTMSFILPESILNIKSHKDIREIILNDTTITKIKYLNRVFKNVFTPVIRLDIVKRKLNSHDLIKAEKNGVVCQVEQSRLQKNIDYIFNVFTDTNDTSLFEKVYKIKHLTLKGNAEWALGVVTGDNKRHLTLIKDKTNEPILTGKDIKKFTSIPAKYFIDFKQNNFQQTAPEYKYRAKEKLIYKFISKELVFAYDNKQVLTLNSANILIPTFDNYPVKTILGLFNSSLYQFIYQKKFGAIKILRGDLEQLPLPIIDHVQHKEIEYLVSKLADNTEKTDIRKLHYDKLDNFIMKLFNLEQNDIDYIKKTINVSNKLLNNI